MASRHVCPLVIFVLAISFGINSGISFPDQDEKYVNPTLLARGFLDNIKRIKRTTAESASDSLLADSAKFVKTSIRRLMDINSKLQDGVEHIFDHELGQYQDIVVQIANASLYPRELINRKPTQPWIQKHFDGSLRMSMDNYLKPTSSKTKAVQLFFAKLLAVKLCQIHSFLETLTGKNEEQQVEELAEWIKNTEDGHIQAATHFATYRMMEFAENGALETLRDDISNGAERFAILNRNLTVDVVQHISEVEWRSRRLQDNRCQNSRTSVLF